MASEGISLSRDQIERFAADGFLAIERIASAGEVTRLRALYDSVLADPSGLTLTYRGERTAVPCEIPAGRVSPLDHQA